MRQLLTVLFCSLCILKINAQKFTINDKEITGIFEASEKNKSEIFAQVSRWISINYNSAKSVIQLTDPEAGNIIVKGTNEVLYKNPFKAVYPNNKAIEEIVSVYCNHTIEFNIKDGKYRMIYRITGVENEDKNVTSSIKFFNCVALDTIDLNKIAEYNADADKYLKMGLVGKERRLSYASASESGFRDIQKKLVTDISSTMESVYKSVNAKTESW